MKVIEKVFYKDVRTCVCVWVCVRERERELYQRAHVVDKVLEPNCQRAKIEICHSHTYDVQGEQACVCVCVCVRERERERERKREMSPSTSSKVCRLPLTQKFHSRSKTF